MGWITKDCENCDGKGVEGQYNSDMAGDFTFDEYCCYVCKGDGKQVEPDGLEVVFQFLETLK